MERILYLYTPESMADWEPGYITAELKSGRFLKEGISFRLVLCGKDLSPVSTMGGIPLKPEISIFDIHPGSGNVLILPGSDFWLDDSLTESIHCIRQLLQSDLVIGAICGATMGLASHGLLDTRRHTSNDLQVLKMFCPGYQGEKYYLNEPAVTDGNLITASGLAPVDFAYHIFKKLDVMHESTLTAWYNLHVTRKPEFFYALMESVQ